jgi:hypothetical protein
MKVHKLQPRRSITLRQQAETPPPNPSTADSNNCITRYRSDLIVNGVVPFLDRHPNITVKYELPLDRYHWSTGQAIVNLCCLLEAMYSHPEVPTKASFMMFSPLMDYRVLDLDGARLGAITIQTSTQSWHKKFNVGNVPNFQWRLQGEFDEQGFRDKLSPEMADGAVTPRMVEGGVERCVAFVGKWYLEGI